MAVLPRLKMLILSNNRISRCDNPTTLATVFLLALSLGLHAPICVG